MGKALLLLLLFHLLSSTACNLPPKFPPKAPAPTNIVSPPPPKCPPKAPAPSTVLTPPPPPKCPPKAPAPSTVMTPPPPKCPPAAPAPTNVVSPPAPPPAKCPPKAPAPTNVVSPPAPPPPPKCPPKAPAPTNVVSPPLNTCPSEMGACVEWPTRLGFGQCCAAVDALGGSAAVCLCTAIKLKALSVKLYVPIADHIFVFCGVILPPPLLVCPP